MVQQLRAKPGADAVPVTVGNMPTARVPGTFTLVYLVANTIMNVTTQDPLPAAPGRRHPERPVADRLLELHTGINPTDLTRNINQIQQALIASAKDKTTHLRD